MRTIEEEVQYVIEKVVQYVIDDTLGTCKCMFSSMSDAVKEGICTQEFFEVNEVEILKAIDREIFECDCCGWVCDISELEEDNICSGCYDES